MQRIRQPAFINEFINSILDSLGSDERVILTETDCTRIVKGDSKYPGASKNGGQGVPQELFDCVNNFQNNFVAFKIASALKDMKGKTFTYENVTVN